MHSPEFEIEIVKIQRGNVDGLPTEEERKASVLLTCRNTVVAEIDDDLSFTQLALKPQKVAQLSPVDEFIDTRFLLPTSNICKMTLSERRRALHHANLEILIFLHFNRDLWGSIDIGEIVSA